MSIRFLSGVNVDQNTLFVDDANNKVGIGTASPTYQLDVAGYGRFSYDGTNNVGAVVIDQLATGNASRIIGYNGSGALNNLISANGNSYFNGGNVGIGTTSPSQKLDVAGNIALSTGGYIYGDSTTPNIRLSTAGGAFLQYGSSSLQNGGSLQFVTASGTMFRINSSGGGYVSSGNFGIGTTSPSEKLEVAGNGLFTGGVYVNSASAFLWNNTNGVIRFGTSGTERARIDATGNVGIGTTSPTTKLHVAGITQIAESGNNAFYGGNYVRVFDDQNFNFRNVSGTTVANISVNGSSYFNGGNVGIGTTGPSTLLQVSGVPSTANFTIGDIANSHLTILDTTTPSAVGVGGRISFGSTYYTQGSTVGQAYIGGYKEYGPTNAADEYYHALVFGTHTSSAEGVTEKMRISSSGNVGIGTTSPAKKLSVVDSTDPTIIVGDTSGRYIYIKGGTSTRTPNISSYSGLGLGGTQDAFHAYITSSGNVGIGTTSPSYKLDVAGSASVYDSFVIRQASNSASVADLYADYTRLLITAGGSTGANHYLALQTQDNYTKYERLRITYDGNVGIGTASPGYKLHVVGDTRIEGNLTINGTVTQIDTDTLTTEQWLVTNDGTGPAVVINQKGTQPVIDIQDDGTSVLYIEDGGDVGIGTTSPSQKLDVANGGIGFSGTGLNATDKKIYSPADGVLEWMTHNSAGEHGFAVSHQGSKKVFLNTSGNSYLIGGNLGVGTATPSYALHVVGDVALQGNDILLGASGLTTYARFVNAGANYLYAESGGTLSFGSNGATNHIFIGTSGNVGIGTTTPAYKLDIRTTSSEDAQIALRNTSTGAAGIYFDASNGDLVGSDYVWIGQRNDLIFDINTSSGAGDIVLSPGGNERVRFAKTGNVGIGTTSAQTKLQVNGSSNSFVSHFGPGTDNSSGKWSGISLGYSEANVYYRKVGIVSETIGDTAARQNLHFLVDTVNDQNSAVLTDSKMMIAGLTGNVGIGTTNPETPLHVVFPKTVRNQLDDIITLTATSPGISALYSPSGLGILWKGETYNNANVEQARIYTRANDHSESTLGTDLIFQTASDNAGTIADRMIITYDGNVGIGTTSPSEKFEVVGNIKLGDGAQRNIIGALNNSLGIYASPNSNTEGIIFSTDNGTTAEMFIQDGGNVGIGTTSPSGKLHIANDGPSALIIGDTQVSTIGETDNGGYPGMKIVPYNSNIHIGISSTADNKINLWYLGQNYTYWQQLSTYSVISNYSTNALVLQVNGGNVGIGTTSPSQKLHVNGYINANGYLTTGTTFRKSFNIGNITGGTTFALGRLNFESVYTHHFKVTISSFYGTKTFEFTGYQTSLNKSVSGVKGGGEVVVETIVDGTSQVTGVKIGVTTTPPDYVYTATVECLSTFLSWEDYSSSTTITPTSLGYDNTFLAIGNTKLGIGTTSPSNSKVHIRGNGQYVGTDGYNTLTLEDDSGYPGLRFMEGSNNWLIRKTSAHNLEFLHSSNASSPGVGSYSNRLTVLSSGNVGIGTSSPSYKLDVAGQAQIVSGIVTNTGTPVKMIVSGGALNDSTELRTGSGEFKIYSGRYNSAHQAFVFATGDNYTSGAERMRITSAGNVGIGTTSPSSALDVSLSSGGTSGIRFKGYSDASTPYLLSLGTQTYQDIFQIKSVNGLVTMGIVGAVGSTPDLAFQTNTTERMRITSAGNVGIGTTSPSSKLDVIGTGVFGTMTSSRSSYSNGLSLQNNSGQATSLFLWQSGVASAHIGSPANSTSLHIVNSYNTGLITDPNSIVLTNTGNVGIGTASPTRLLDVSAVNPQMTLKSTTTTGFSEYYFSDSDGDPGYLSYAHNGDYLSIGVNGSDRMRITSAGTVGIGTTSPNSSYKLDVYGAVRVKSASGVYIDATDYGDNSGGTIEILNRGTTRALRITGTTGSGWGDVLLNPYGAYVGIGTTDPTQALHVSGNVRVTGAYYDSNNSAGTSGQVLSSTGSGTAWVNQGEATATSLFDLLPAARVTYDWTVQLTAGTWADIFSSTTVLSNGTWMVQAYVSDFAVGGQQYQETYSGIMSWGNAQSTNEVGPEAISEVVLHRSGHAANSGNFYLRTVERASSTLLLQGMSNLSHTASTTINFKFVKIF